MRPGALCGNVLFLCDADFLLRGRLQPSSNLGFLSYHVPHHTVPLYGRNPISKHQIQPKYGDEQADAGRETAETVSRDQILRLERGQGNFHFHCSANHEQDWQPYPVDPHPCYM